MDEPRSFTRSPMSLNPHAGDWLKMPTEKLEAALAAEPPDSGNARTIKSILDSRNAAQVAKALAAVADQNRAMTEELQKIATQNSATSKRLARVAVIVSVLTVIAVIAAVICVLRR